MSNKQIYKQNLQFFIESIDEITELIRKNKPMNEEVKQEVQRMFTVFKKNLKDTLKNANQYEKTSIAEDYDFNNYSRALHDVSANMTIRTNSNPSQNWLNELYDAKFSLEWGVQHIKDEDK
ncbi:hypothetical protein [Bacillus inaquosorum]|uniref:hypothetical protein n=1 Tax=Bacillus inaquosorum TaxID=483913 RepID=UPI002281781D|nr:hypothetical protein [Bacillus inaquosorum]MCY7759724.1 hypothetical protein [Bacillus inaquosorum]MCY7767089.1 hypothetical protein [Bacillus inaquosorum]MCY8731582.1 hypothetical protein [Bacillus inaquosorum]MCY9099602.1 hypothetical protein [Bacillus inaquosorum]